MKKKKKEVQVCMTFDKTFCVTFDVGQPNYRFFDKTARGQEVKFGGIIGDALGIMIR
jgi:hypothetical protein